jgi:hypothetical protein
MSVEIVRAGAEVVLEAPYRDPPLSLRVEGLLFVETSDGRRLHATGGTVGAVFAGGRSDDPALRVSRSDVEREMQFMVGRDTDRALPPHIGWEQLAEVLEREGIAISEGPLTGVPFVVELSDALLRALDH